VRQHNDDGDHRRDPWIGRAQCRARVGIGNRERDQEPDQDQADIGGEQKEADLERQNQPVSAPLLADGAPVVQQDQRPQRHGQDHRAEIRGRHREGGDAQHEQHRQRGVLGADDRASQREHRPVGRHHANLRQQVDAEHVAAGDLVGEFGKPEGERRP
jgi:hypothetical protein